MVMTIRPPSPRLRYLVDSHMDGGITGVELAELEVFLRDKESMVYYLRTAEVEAGLRILGQADADDLALQVEPSSSVIMMPDSRNHAWFAIAAMVAILLAALGVVLLSSQRGGGTVEARPASSSSPAAPQSPVVLAALTRSFHADVVRGDLHVGDLTTIASGLVEIECVGGSLILLEGPAQLEFTSLSELTLHYGRCVVRVLRSASKIRVHTPRGSVFTREAEFAVEVSPTGDRVVLGVFEGQTQVRATPGGQPVRVDRGQALRLGSPEGSPEAIASHFDSFLRRFPSREFAWVAPPDCFESTTLDHDLSGLILEPGDYFAHFKWTHGVDALAIHSVELLCDGRPISADSHAGMTGNWHFTEANTYSFTIASQDYRRGQWTLRTRVRALPRSLENVQLPDEFLAKHEDILLADAPGLQEARERIFRHAPARPDSHGLILFDRGLGASTQASLMLHYTFDEGVGETAASSVYSTTGNTLKLINLGFDTDWGPGKIGPGAVRIVSSAGLVRAVDPSSWGVTAPNVSLALWVNLDEDSGHAAPNLAGALNNKTHSHQYLIRADSRGLLAGGFVRDADQTHVIQTLRAPSTAIPKNTWTHLAMTFEQDSRTLKFYLNGILIQEETAKAWTEWGEAVELDFAGLGHPGNYSLSGLYDDVRIYGSVLRPEDIRILAAE